MSVRKQKITHEQLQTIYNLKFLSNDLGTELTVGDWLKLLLKRVLTEQEDFSGKHPFGNGDWEADVTHALVVAGFVRGTIDSVDGTLLDVDSNRVTEILNAVVDRFVV